jgi:uncharacterized protein YjbJ (UPF0337 family)
MGDKTDRAKGRVKAAVGSLTDDAELKREGRADRVSGEIRQKLSNAEEKAEAVIDAVKERVEAVLDTAKDSVHRSPS